MESPLTKLSLEYWYQLLLAVAVLVLLAALGGVFNGVAIAGPVAVIALGSALVGIGEVANHPYQCRLVPGGKIYGHPYSPCFIGLLLDALGVALIGIGAWRLL